MEETKLNLSEHPEYKRYHRQREFTALYRTVLERWRDEGRPIHVSDHDITWTYERAQHFAQNLALLMDVYNRTLWEDLPYCRRCGGDCCVNRHFTPAACEIDALILGLLGLEAPTLEAEIEAPDQGCVYLTSQGCSFPKEWRPLICSTYFCLGQEDSSLSAPEMIRVAEELDWVIALLMPDELDQWAKKTLGRRFYITGYQWGLPPWDCLAPQDLAELMWNGIIDLLMWPLTLAYRDEYPALDPERAFYE
jgi:hypothetical protein